MFLAKYLHNGNQSILSNEILHCKSNRCLRGFYREMGVQGFHNYRVLLSTKSALIVTSILNKPYGEYYYVFIYRYIPVISKNYQQNFEIIYMFTRICKKIYAGNACKR